MYNDAYLNTIDSTTLKSARLIDQIDKNNIKIENTKKLIDKELENILCGQNSKQHYENKLQQQIQNWKTNFARDIDFQSQLKNF